MARLPVPQGDPARPVSGRAARAVGGERERADLLALDETALDDVPWDTPAVLTVHIVDDPARSALWSSKCGKVNFSLTANFTSDINEARNADSRASSAIPAFRRPRYARPAEGQFPAPSRRRHPLFVGINADVQVADEQW